MQCLTHLLQPGVVLTQVQPQHRPIVIGKDGVKLREISRLARGDIEQMLGKPVFLEVWVRVRRGWSDDARALKSLGYE